MIARALTDPTDLVLYLLLSVLVLAVVFFVVRPELWRRLWWARVDPRPLALTRIAFGLVCLWAFVSLATEAHVLLTDEGMWLPDSARAQFGGAARPTILHYSSHPWLVRALYALMLGSLGLMTLGLWTRWTTILSWVLVLQVYRYQPMYYSGADFVIQNFLFLGMLSRWGETYSLDSWRRRRASARAGDSATLADPRPIPAWPMRLMMLQLALIYCATGLIKHGETWAHGEALYYALNLDHFYRMPAQGLVAWLQSAGVLGVLTHVVRWWEVLFPVALVGAALRGYEADRAAGRWPVVSPWRRRLSWLVAAGIWLLLSVTAGTLSAHHGTPGGIRLGSTPRQQQVVIAVLVTLAPVVLIAAYRFVRRHRPRLFRALLHYAMGKRFWLVFGLLLHVGIEVLIDVGIFGEVMVAVYFVWLTGPELDAFERTVRARLQPLLPTPARI